ncbi:MAG TPA: aldo/keto reductase [Leptospiraceae bacterium]|nr:aldo/keto reductase [Leptospiraceae bacterium]HMY65552.1 aldo/keto reductase [Leptospiraceae bacterium]HMZ60779.1 aldo/keto reductase [Leptospiraceae bacterium]HNF16801.1 aldo/keto reductase [Leptospiraceae bacterium]HNI27831.1 aldo/keto reductase [Leptospiraceae bacterium]
MKKRRLGKSGIVVSEIGMGTMTFGSTCDEPTAFKVMDKALDAGVDFFDTAEVYPVPPDEKYVFKTEEIVGKWLKARKRDSVIIASKVAGPGHGWFSPPVRSGKTALDRHSIMKAVEGSLKRLGTDYIDLYQTHWPDPDMYHEETLFALTELVQSGKVRYIGCSNETPWGLMKSLWASEKNRLVRYESIQNNFSMLNRRFEDSLAEICKKEGVSLIAYSPLAGGVLSGKYNTNKIPENARFTKYAKLAERQKKQSSRYLNELTVGATAGFMKIAKEMGISVTTLAIAWSKQNDFTASTLIGANTVDQLNDSLKAADVIIPNEILDKINEVSKNIPYPMG